MRDKLRHMAVEGVGKEEALEIIGEMLEREMRDFKADPKHAMEHAREFARNERLMDARMKGIGTQADAMHLIEHALIRTARDMVSAGIGEGMIPKIAEKAYACFELHKSGMHLEEIPLKFI